MHARTAVDLPVFMKDAMDLPGQIAIFSLVGARLALLPVIVTTHTPPQRATQRRDRILLTVLSTKGIP